MSTLDALKERIHSLEAERSRLENEVEILRKAAENRAISLEKDIDEMREESQVLRELLFSNEKAGMVTSAPKPAASPPMSTNVQAARDMPAQKKVTEAPEMTVSASKPSVSAVDTAAQPQVEAVPQIPQATPQAVSEPAVTESAPEKSEIEEESNDDVMKNLNVEEQKIVEVLNNHGGRYAQRSIRTEAGLSWLQANRIITHLADLGVVGLEKNGEVVLKESLK